MHTYLAFMLHTVAMRLGCGSILKTGGMPTLCARRESSKELYDHVCCEVGKQIRCKKKKQPSREIRAREKRSMGPMHHAMQRSAVASRASVSQSLDCTTLTNHAAV